MARFRPASRHEQKGKRPALVLSPRIYNEKAGLALLCPITSQVKGYPFEVKISEGKVSGVVLSDQIKSLDWRARRVRYAGTTSPRIVAEVQSNLQMLLF